MKFVTKVWDEKRNNDDKKCSERSREKPLEQWL